MSGMKPYLDTEGRYCQQLIDALEGDSQSFIERLKLRWQGEDGPSLERAPSWSKILTRAWRETPESGKNQWNKSLLGILREFDQVTDDTLSPDRRKVWLGALELAGQIAWGEEDAVLLRSRVAGWLELASPGYSFPVPYHFWQQERFAGQPEVDPLTPILRLAAQHLTWGKVAEGLWQREETAEAAIPKITAARLWQIAHWAINQEEFNWLGKHLDGLTQSLEKTGWVSGNLTKLFFYAERVWGEEQVVKLILSTPMPDTIQRRQALAPHLDYFGEDNLETRIHYWEIFSDRGEKKERGVLFHLEPDELEKELAAEEKTRKTINEHQIKRKKTKEEKTKKMKSDIKSNWHNKVTEKKAVND
ncbi:MAG: hypothetical protein HQL52_19695 [Magnetococcales bacterium]|nr:hypothetical protein [Magnetococcales bacterium]